MSYVPRFGSVSRTLLAVGLATVALVAGVSRVEGVRALAQTRPAPEGAEAVRPETPRTTIGLLAPLGRLDATIVRAWEDRMKVNVRVDFVTSGAEYEARLRSSPHAWDVVVADEQRLASLFFAKIIRALPASVPGVPAPGTASDTGPASVLWRPGRYVEGERAFAPLMADPLGLAWLGDTRAAKEPVTWDWLVEPKANPLWRSRTALPADKRLQFLIASAQLGFATPPTDANSAKPVMEWLRAARHQARANPLRIESELLSGRAAAAVLWQSEYERVRKLVPRLEFAVPRKGAYVERHGVGLVSESFHEKEALSLLMHLLESRDALAKTAGLVPVRDDPSRNDEFSTWRITAEHLPIVKAVETELEKLR